MSASHARSWQQTWQDNTNPTRQTQPERKQEVKVKQHKRWITTGEKFLYSFFSVLIVVALFFTVSFSSNTDSLNRDTQQLEQSVNQQEIVNQNLSYKVKEFSNPDRILRIAKENGLKIQNTKIKQASTMTN